MSGVRARLLAFLAGIAVSGVLRVSAMEVYTPEEVESVNGTDAKLKCTFQSSSPLKESSASVSWHFRPLGGGAEESVFFYQDGQYPPSEGRFRGRAVWAGNLNRYDGSIMVRDVQFRDNGTFVCQVKNPPDVHGVSGEIRFRVVTTAWNKSFACSYGFMRRPAE
nr:PREDICTED: myelin protein zero-like protein 2 isoform X5 [Lepisosteus oculatus]